MTITTTDKTTVELLDDQEVNDQIHGLLAEAGKSLEELQAHRATLTARELVILAAIEDLLWLVS